MVTLQLRRRPRKLSELPSRLSRRQASRNRCVASCSCVLALKPFCSLNERSIGQVGRQRRSCTEEEKAGKGGGSAFCQYNQAGREEGSVLWPPEDLHVGIDILTKAVNPTQTCPERCGPATNLSPSNRIGTLGG